MSDTKAKGTILIVEDSAPNRKILAHLIEKLGFAVIACEDGEEAWKILSAGKLQNLEAVISDLMMPKMDGLQLLKNVRDSQELKNLPFLLVTAVSDKNYIVQAKDLHVTGYVLKPLTFQRVSEKLQEIFPDKQLPKIAV